MKTLSTILACCLGLTLATPNLIARDTTSELQSGDSLYIGQKLVSENGRAMVTLQGDGNLVIYDITAGLNNGRPIWSSGTAANPVYCLTLDPSGILKLYENSNSAATSWTSASSGQAQHGGPYTLVMQDDANLVIYSQNGASVWDSETWGKLQSKYVIFSKISYTNAASDTEVYPVAQGSLATWDTRNADKSADPYWLIAQGQTKVANFDIDYILVNSQQVKIGKYIGGDGTLCSLGFDAAWADKSFVDPQNSVQFQYQANSNQCLSVKKYGTPDSGYVAFEGVISC